jgi:hypothetical protein
MSENKNVEVNAGLSDLRGRKKNSRKTTVVKKHRLKHHRKEGI